MQLWAFRKLQTLWCRGREKFSGMETNTACYIWVENVPDWLIDISLSFCCHFRLEPFWRMGNMMRGGIARNKLDTQNFDSAQKSKFLNNIKQCSEETNLWAHEQYFPKPLSKVSLMRQTGMNVSELVRWCSFECVNLSTKSQVLQL